MPSASFFVTNRPALVKGKQSTLRGHALDILEAGLERGIPEVGTQRVVSRSGSLLTVDGETYDLRAFDRVILLGAGKASYPIAKALEDILGDDLTGGVLVLKKGETRRLKRVEVLEAAHPTPDETSVQAGRRLLAMAEACTERDLVLAVFTGGATSLATVPLPGLTLRDLVAMNDLVLTSGADIKEMNVVRRHLCRLKGGRLVVAAQPATVITFTLDTALKGMPWPDVCLPDPNTFADAIALLHRYRIWDKSPVAVRTYLEEGLRHPERETVKSFAGVNARTVMVGDPLSMCRAAAAKAEALGYAPLVLGIRMNGEAREVGVCQAGIAHAVLTSSLPLPAPCALISCGECTVAIRGEAGLGGPNQEFVLGFVSELGGERRWVCAALDTDGTDGPTDWAGGIVDNTTGDLARERGIDIAEALFAHDSFAALNALDGIIHTGHTGTNLQHLRVILIGDDAK